MNEDLVNGVVTRNMSLFANKKLLILPQIHTQHTEKHTGSVGIIVDHISGKLVSSLNGDMVFNHVGKHH